MPESNIIKMPKQESVAAEASNGRPSLLCPLAFQMGQGPLGQSVLASAFCVREKCAWWMESNQCALPAIANGVSLLMELEDIASALTASSGPQF